MFIDFWHWWVIAALLGALDMVAQSGFFLWLGFAALMVGVIVFALPDISWQMQLFAFASMAILAVITTRHFIRRGPIATDQPLLNRRGEQYIGKLVVLESAIVNQKGRAYVGDTLWTVEGDDLPVGETVRVIGTNGALLRVKKAQTTQ
ncbi:inner membrane protein [Azospirillaceae bacterium]